MATAKSTCNLFKCPELIQLYKQGDLDEVLHNFRDIINNQTLLASGGDASVFDYRNGSHVIKLVPKSIRFFKHFGKGIKSSAIDFQKHVNNLDPYFLPVEEILYEDEHVFIYSQRKTQLLNTKSIDGNTVIDIFRLVQFMILSDVILTDLAPHNLGVLNNHVLVFDYHGLHKLKKNGQIKRGGWWRRIARNLTRFICIIYVPERRKEFAKLMQNCDANVIKQMESETKMPIPFIELLKYLLNQQNQQNQFSIERIDEYLELCITDIKDNFLTVKPSSSRKHRQKTK